ncbi:MAG: gamma-butyrobetaine hydroxylase-like domain-containing protein, partial [Candidatus Puniceispirillaceae bacterium]
MNDTPWPSEIRLSADKRTLNVTFEGGTSVALSAELLRVESPSAEVQGHGAGQKTTPLGKQDVCISRIEPVGNYAVRLVFDDGHDTGLYSWARECWKAACRSSDCVLGRSCANHACLTF